MEGLKYKGIKTDATGLWRTGGIGHSPLRTGYQGKPHADFTISTPIIIVIIIIVIIVNIIIIKMVIDNIISFKKKTISD